MTTNISQATLWQRKLASLIRSGLFKRAELAQARGLHVIVGVYGDDRLSAPLAKFADRLRAEDALNVIQHLADPLIPAGLN
jgi:hypothetical protein